jgi:metal-sulfur cluster biosynthetic enzyme
MKVFSREDVISRLREVIDPCSAATQVPLSIVEMGMVESVVWESGNAVIALRMTSPLCHALPYFQMEIERVLAGFPGIVGVECTFDHGGNWQPDNMTVGAQQKLADQRKFVRIQAEERNLDFPIIQPGEVSESAEASLNSRRSNLQTTSYEMEKDTDYPDLPVCLDNHDHTQ